MGDEEFADYIAGRLAGVPGVLAVSLGGSRASGTSRPDSDWDFAVYYRGRFDPGDLSALGWPGEVSAIGAGAAECSMAARGCGCRAGRPVDVHYRDLDDVEHRIAEAREGRFGIERLMFHLAGIPTYIVAAELALHRVLRGSLPRPEYPDKLRVSASQRWRADARLTLGYARGHAARGHVADTAGFIATAAAQAAHAVLVRASLAAAVTACTPVDRCPPGGCRLAGRKRHRCSIAVAGAAAMLHRCCLPRGRGASAGPTGGSGGARVTGGARGSRPGRGPAYLLVNNRRLLIAAGACALRRPH